MPLLPLNSDQLPKRLPGLTLVYRVLKDCAEEQKGGGRREKLHVLYYLYTRDLPTSYSKQIINSRANCFSNLITIINIIQDSYLKSLIEL